MKFLVALAGFVTALTVIASSPRPVHAAFHCMRIHAVAGGFAGNPNVQFVELRMNAPGQPFVAGHTVKFFDSSGVLKATFTFPSNVPNSSVGDSVLIGTSEFNALTNGGDADFTFTNANTTGSNGGDPLHPVQVPGGLVHFAQGSDNCDADVSAGPGEVDSLAYGAATAHFGSAAIAMPSSPDDKSHRLGNLSTTPTDNSAEYTRETLATSSFAVAPANLPSNLTAPRNNSRVVLALTPPPVGGIDTDFAVAGDVQRRTVKPERGGRERTALLTVLVALGTAAIGGAAWRLRIPR